MAHATNSPSVFARRKMCPGSKRLEAGLPDKDNEYSLRGSAAHAVLEACLSEKEHVTDYRGADVVVTTAEGTTTTVKMEEDDIKAISAAVDYYKLRAQQMEWRQLEFFEKKLTPSLWLNRPEADCDGTGDIGLIGWEYEGVPANEAPSAQYAKRAVVESIDYKHGANPVECENNTQLLLYAIGACQMVDWNQWDQTTTIVRMTIIQPRARHKDGPVRFWEITADELFAKLPELQAIAEATDDPNAPLVPGDHCRWCKANPCEAVNAQNQAKVQAAFSPVEQGPVDLAEVEVQMGRPPELLNPQQLAKVMDLEAFAVGWFKAVREAANHQAGLGQKIPGYKRVHANTKRKWGEGPEVIIKKLMGLRDTRDAEGKKKFAKADVTRVVPISITDVEKQVKPYVTERQWKTFSQYIVKPEGAPVLAPDTDSRPEIKGAEEVFQPVNQPAPAEKAPWE